MGYSGRILLAHSARPLSELAALDDAEILSESRYRDRWHSVQLDGDLPGALRALVTATGAPALSAYIVDSDLADVEALTPTGTSWHAYLHEDTALSYGAAPLDQSTDEVVRQALAWCAEAGLTPEPAGLVDALTAHHVFAEDSLENLLMTLGLTPET